MMMVPRVSTPPTSSAMSEPWAGGISDSRSSVYLSHQYTNVKVAVAIQSRMGIAALYIRVTKRIVSTPE